MVLTVGIGDTRAVNDAATDAEQFAQENGWRHSNSNPKIYKKDGYELYIQMGEPVLGLSIRDPDTRERESVLSVTVDPSSPLFVALLQHMIEHAESIVHKYQNNEN